ncbi:MAG TPA: type II toxin-antitoxin system HicB family antitoxin [Ktedonobacterales bacterium]|jgi:predicted RNase H-like HicB family nuclease
MKTNPVTYPESAYRTEIVPEVLTDGRLIYVASHPEIRRVRSQGDTPEEARENLSDAFALYKEHCMEHWFDMPAPQQSGVKEVIWRTFPINETLTASSLSPTLLSCQSMPSISIHQLTIESDTSALKSKG